MLSMPKSAVLPPLGSTGSEGATGNSYVVSYYGQKKFRLLQSHCPDKIYNERIKPVLSSG